MFETITNKQQLEEINGGAALIITGAMVIKAIGCVGAGVAFGTAIGKTIKGICG